MTNKTEGRYDKKPWSKPSIVLDGVEGVSEVQARWTYAGPFASRAEQLTQQALMMATIPGKDIQKMVRPPLPQVVLFPPRFGYGERTQPTLDDIVVVDRTYAEPRVSWFSGGPAGYQAAERNALGSD